MDGPVRRRAYLLTTGAVLVLWLSACDTTATTGGAGTGVPAAVATPCPPAGFGDTVGGTAGHTTTGQGDPTGEGSTAAGSDPAATSESTPEDDGTPDAGATPAARGAAGGASAPTDAEGTPGADPCTRPGE
jgi:hypothetical protein